VGDSRELLPDFAERGCREGREPKRSAAGAGPVKIEHQADWPTISLSMECMTYARRKEDGCARLDGVVLAGNLLFTASAQVEQALAETVAVRPDICGFRQVAVQRELPNMYARDPNIEFLKNEWLILFHALTAASQT
jgi:hypothetical protein